MLCLGVYNFLVLWQRTDIFPPMLTIKSVQLCRVKELHMFCVPAFRQRTLHAVGPAAVLGGRLLRRCHVGARGDGNGPGTTGDD